MKNYEKYAEVFKKWNESHHLCEEFIDPNILKPIGRKCETTSCGLCNTLRMIWLMEEYEEPEVEWSKVEIDTPILVRDYEDEGWGKRYFAKYEDGLVYSWVNGKTGWVLDYDSNYMTVWKYAKLAESEEGGAE